MSSLFAGNLSKVHFFRSRPFFDECSRKYQPTILHRRIKYDTFLKINNAPSKIVSFSLRSSSVTEILDANTPSSPSSLLVPLCHMPPVCRPFRPSILSRPAHPYCLLFSVFGFPHYISVFLISMFHNTSKHYQNHTQRQFCGVGNEINQIDR